MLNFAGTQQQSPYGHLQEQAMWQALLTSLIGEDTSGLILSLGNGNEIAVQQILHATAEAVVLRGRWAGSSESGWTFLVPWSQIVCCVFSRSLPEKLQQQLGLPAATPTSDVSPETARPVETSSAPATLSATPSAPATAQTISRPTPDDRLEQLRQRLRQRLQQ